MADDSELRRAVGDVLQDAYDNNCGDDYDWMLKRLISNWQKDQRAESLKWELMRNGLREIANSVKHCQRTRAKRPLQQQEQITWQQRGIHPRDAKAKTAWHKDHARANLAEAIKQEATRLLDTFVVNGGVLGDLDKQGLLMHANTAEAQEAGHAARKTFFRDLAKHAKDGTPLRETIKPEEIIAAHERAFNSKVKPNAAA